MKAQVGSMAVNHALTALINSELGPELIGQDPRDINRIWDSFYNGVRAHYALRDIAERMRGPVVTRTKAGSPLSRG